MSKKINFLMLFISNVFSKGAVFIKDFMILLLVGAGPQTDMFYLSNNIFFFMTQYLGGEFHFLFASESTRKKDIKFETTVTYYVVGMIFVFHIGTILFSRQIANLFFLPERSMSAFIDFIIIQSASAILFAVFLMKKLFCNVDSDFKKFSQLNLIYPVINLLLFLVLFHFTGNVFSMVTSTLFATIIMMFFMNNALLKRLSPFNISLSIQTHLTFIRKAALVFIVYLLEGASIMYISYLATKSGEKIATYVNWGLRLPILIVTFFSINLSFVLIPEISDLRDHGKLKARLRPILKYTFLINGAVIALFYLSIGLIPERWISETAAGIIYQLKFFIFLLPFNNLHCFMIQFFNASRRTAAYALTASAGIILTMAMNHFLYPVYGVKMLGINYAAGQMVISVLLTIIFFLSPQKPVTSEPQPAD